MIAGTDIQDALAALRVKTLERDDESDPGGRIYRNPTTGEVFHSVTRILQATMPEKNRLALERWLERPSAAEDRDMAAQRGTHAHSSAEYCLKTANKLARHTANKRNSWRVAEDGLYRAPKAITRWALEKSIAGCPKVPWSASGYARGLRGWIADHVTSIHAIEFSGYHPAGFAGSCDALVDLGGTGPFVTDWKTTGKSLHSDMAGTLEGYRHQTGAYSLILKHLTGIQPVGGAVVVARRSGEPICTLLTKDELKLAEQRFLERCTRYFAGLTACS